jgi:hypothetical protein
MADSPDDQVQRVEGNGITWIEIATFGTIEEANLLRGFLEAEGIDAQVENVQSEILPANFGMLGDIRLYVPAQQESQALELMAKRESEYDKLDDDGEDVVTDEGTAEIDDNAETEDETEGQQ